MNIHFKQAIVLVLNLMMIAACAGPPSQLPATVEMVEEPTEEFANSMLDLAVAIRIGRHETVAASFSEKLMATSWPTPEADGQEGPEWAFRHGWLLVATPQQVDREGFLTGLHHLLGHFSEIEDLRLKVKRSELDSEGQSINATVALSLVGRDRDGRREWLRGRAEIIAENDLHGRWLIHHFQMTELESMVADRDIFEEVADAAGLGSMAPAFGNRKGSPFAAYGAAAGDVNNDGLIDMVVVSEGRNFLYLNRGTGQFEDVAEQALVRTLDGEAVAPLLFDMDNDGDLDIFFSVIGEQALFENRLAPDGRLEFWDVSLEARVARKATGFSAVAGDVDGNGFADVYVASYNRYGEVLPDRWDGASNGTANLLFLNQGDGTFEEVAAARGVADDQWSYAAGMIDIDRDFDLDIYVANDFGGANSLFLNQGENFDERSNETGVSDGGYGMGVSFGDFDNDGDFDLHVTRMSSTAGKRILARVANEELPSRERLKKMAVGNALYENTGSGFSEISSTAGPFSAGWAWGGGFFDFDNDGWEDLFTPNGFVSGSRLHDT